MKTVPLGATGLNVSNLCLGTMQFGWTADEPASFAVMDAFVAAGGNFIDTADVYSSWAPGNPGGVSEEIIGRWMKARGNRDHIVLATKVRGRDVEGPDGEGLSRAHMRARRRRQPAPASGRHYRPLPVPLARRQHADRRDADRLRRADRVRQGAPHRRVQLPALAPRAGSGSRGREVAAALRDAPAAPQPRPPRRVRDELAAICEREGIGVIPYSPLPAVSSPASTAAASRSRKASAPRTTNTI